MCVGFYRLLRWVGLHGYCFGHGIWREQAGSEVCGHDPDELGGMLSKLSRTVIEFRFQGAS